MKKIFLYIALVLLSMSCSLELPENIKSLKTCQVPTGISAIPDPTNPKIYTFTLTGIVTDIVYPITWKWGTSTLGTSLTAPSFRAGSFDEGSYTISAEVTTKCGSKLTLSTPITVKIPITTANTFALTDPIVHAQLRAAVVTNDGTVIANEYNDIKVWNFQANTLLRTLKGHTNVITDMVLSTDEKYLFTSSFDSNIIVFDWKTGTEVRRLTGHNGPVYSLSVSADNKYVVSSAGDKTIKIWNVSDGTLTRTITNDEIVFNIAISTDAKYIAGSGNSSTSKLKIWDGTNGNLLSNYNENGTFYLGMAFSPDGSKLFSRQNATGSGRIKVYNTLTQQVLKEIGNINGGFEVSFTPDGKFCMAGNTLIDATTYSVLWTKYHNNKNYTSENSSISINGLYGLQWQGGNIALVKPITTGDAYPRVAIKHQSNIGFAEILPNKNQVIIGSFYNDYQGFNFQGQETLKLATTVGSRYGIVASNNYLLSSGCGEVNIWKQSDGSLLKTIVANRNSCGAIIAASSDDTFFAVRDQINSNGRNIDIYDIATGTKLRSLIGHSNYVDGVIISPDNKNIVTYSPVDKTVIIWDAGTGMNKRTIATTSGNSYYNRSLRVSPDGKYLAMTDAGFVKIYNFLDGTLLTTINNSGLNYTNLTFSPDSKYLAGASGSTTLNNSKLRIWNVLDGSFKESTIPFIPIKLSFNTTGTQLYVVTEKDFQVLTI